MTDAQWERLRPLLPPQKPRTGRHCKDHRAVLDGILWVLRTGSPWRALPERYGSWKTVSGRFYRWTRAGVWDRVLSTLQRQADAEGRLDWSLHFVDSTVVRAHQHAAGAKGGSRKRGAWSEPRWVHHKDPSSCRVSWKAHRGGADGRAAARATGAPDPHGTRGGQATGTRPPAYSARPGGRRQGGQQPHDPPVPQGAQDRGGHPGEGRRGEAPDPAFDRAAYRERNVVERLINRLKQRRRTATRYEKRAANYEAMLTVACIQLWL